MFKTIVHTPLTPEEKQEFNQLKRVRCSRGFFLPNEEQRYNVLWDKNAKGVVETLQQFDRIAKCIECN